MRGVKPKLRIPISFNKNNKGFGLLAYEGFKHLHLQIRLLASIKMSAFCSNPTLDEGFGLIQI